MRTLSEHAAAVANGETSAVELTEAALEAAHDVQSTLNAFTVFLDDRALAWAKHLDASDRVGPLHGVPIAVKDLYDMADVATTGCCAAYHDRIASSDSAVVEALEGAGAVVVAKTNQHELACGATSQVSSFGAVRNPWDTTRIPGGSSGGSGAVVAAGVVSMAMGSDTGGSIRIPASLCGVTGLKPTHGAVSLRGAMPMCPSLDTAGPLARSAEDCALVHRVIAGYDDEYLWTRSGPEVTFPASGVRIGLPDSYYASLHPETRRGLDDAVRTFEELGFAIVQTAGPNIDEAFGTFGTRMAEISASFRDLWDDERVSGPVADYINFGRAITGADAFSGREVGLRVRRDFMRALGAADVLLAPCTAYPAPGAEEQTVTLDAGSLDVHHGGPARLTLPVNVAGLPSLAFPVGATPEGLPIGAQLIGPDWSELALCSIVAAYQEATDWHLRQPGD